MPAASPSPKLFRSITRIPVDNFITCYCDKDLTALIIDGEPGLDELAESWAIIEKEFRDRMQTEEEKTVAQLTIDYNLLQTKCNILNTLVKALEFVYLPEFVEQLAQWYGMPVTLDPKDKEGFKRQLAMVTARVTRWKSDAISLKRHIDELAPDAGDKKDMLREDFDGLLVSLSQYNKYQIDRRKTTMSEFIIMINNLRRVAAQLERDKNNA